MDLRMTDLHVHSYYSLLDGLNSPKELLEAARAAGHVAMAQTDHGTLAGHRDLQIAAKEVGIKPILGLEAYISETTMDDKRSKAKRTDGTSVYNHIILLAQNAQGYKNLNKLSEVAWAEGFYSKPRIDRASLAEFKEGLIVLSGCMSGLISKAIIAGDVEKAERMAKWFVNELGDNFYIEIQGNNDPALNRGLLSIADRFGIKPVVTGDCHFATKEEREIEDALLILSTNPKFNKDLDFKKSTTIKNMFERYNYIYPDRTMTFEHLDLYLRSRKDIATQLAEQGIEREDVFESTLEITEKIGDYDFNESLDLLPRPKNDNPDAVLQRKVRAGLKRIGKDGNATYEARILEEMKVIKDKDFSTYFLIVENMVTWAKEQGILVGPGRGSAAGSLVCYCLGITGIDPIEYGLLFFRFIDPSRSDWPDIDLDFEDRRRGEVKDYLRRKFKHVASIATYTKFQGKSSVNDAARVFKIPLSETRKAMKKVDAPADKPDLFWEAFYKDENAVAFGKKYPEVISLAKSLQGRIRGGGMHAAGIVVSKNPLEDIVPIETAKDPQDKDAPRVKYIAADMNAAADIGLIKMDALGLKTLSVISDTLKLIKERHGKTIILDNIPLNDQKVYKMLSDGYTQMCFQVEATPYTSLILKMGGLRDFEEIAASNALVRPGAMNTIGAEYIARKNGKKSITYLHDDMKTFTNETYGTVLYQEQVMLSMTELAGMSMGTANKVRKIIGKKRDASEFDAYQEEFINGAEAKIGRDSAAKLWHDFEAHAGYSFNKSHAVAYGMLTYWTAWLKANYTIEFVTAALNNEKDKDTKTDYLIETKRLGVTVKLPHVNKSKANFVIETNDSIRMGIKNIKYLSGVTGDRLIDIAPFKSYKDLHEIVMTKGSGLTVRVLQSLNAIGAAEFPDNPRRGNERDNLYEYLNIPAFNSEMIPPRVLHQVTLLEDYEDKGIMICSAMVRDVRVGDGWARVDMLDETGTAGVFTEENTSIEKGQRYFFMISDNRIVRFATLEDVIGKKRTMFVEYLYRDKFPDVPDPMLKVIAFTPRKTKAGKNMAYVVFSTEFKELISAMVFDKGFMKAYSHCKDGAVVDIDFGTMKDGTLVVNNIL